MSLAGPSQASRAKPVTRGCKEPAMHQRQDRDDVTGFRLCDLPTRPRRQLRAHSSRGSMRQPLAKSDEHGPTGAAVTIMKLYALRSHPTNDPPPGLQVR